MQCILAARSDFGRFYYRFPEGEAGLDVYNRATSFIATLFRDWSRNDPEVQKDMTVIVVTHGLTLRLFLMRWYQYTVREVSHFVFTTASLACLYDVIDLCFSSSGCCSLKSR